MMRSRPLHLIVCALLAALAHASRLISRYSPDGDVVCTSLTTCKKWSPNAWQQEPNECSHSVVFDGSGVGGVPKKLRVFFDLELDGGGASIMALPLVEKIMGHSIALGRLAEREDGEPPFERAFEWCSGPGFIAFSHLAAGVTRRLLLSDINPRAVKCLHKTVEANGLQDLVEVHLGKDFIHIPVPTADSEKVDLVLGNPPNYYKVAADVTMDSMQADQMSHDLRPADPGWKTHQNFFHGIRPYLSEDAAMFIGEVYPDLMDVRFADIGVVRSGYYDTRPEAPRTTFKRMAKEGGLCLSDSVDLAIYSTVLVYTVCPDDTHQALRGGA